MATRPGIPRRKSHEPASAPPGHPARGRSSCRGRSPGSRVVASVWPSRIQTQWRYLTSGHRSQLRGQRRPCSDRTIGPHRLPSWLRGETKSQRPRHPDYGRCPTSRQDKYKDIFISLYWLKPRARDLKHDGDLLVSSTHAMSCSRSPRHTVMGLRIGDCSRRDQVNMARRVVGDRAGSAATRMTYVDTLRERDVDYTFG
jgi:hypothetical protein